MLVRLKKEIISLGMDEIKPVEHTGQYIEPVRFKEWLDEGKEVLVLDTRNDYELRLGTFENAIDLNIKSFRQFPEAIKGLKQDKSTPIVMFCTGGIRCEKAGPLMERYGIDTYQLKGGILKYFEQTNSKLWNGECFVFDYRVSLNKKLSKGTSKLCYGCNTPLTIKETKSPKYEKGFTCPVCFDNMTEKKRRSLKDKREHWKKAF